MATKKENALPVTKIVLPALNLQTFTIQIVGDSPLISHAWSHKAKQMMLSKQMNKAKVGREPKRPMVDFAESLYWLTDKPNLDDLTDEEAKAVLAEIIPKSKFGFPTVSFKSAALDAGYQQGALVRNAGSGDLAKTTARGAFHIQGEFAVIEGTPTPRDDMVRIGQGTADICYRAEFKSWSTKLIIDYNGNVISAEQIINLFRLGGFANGVGDWRPAKDGSFGTFHVE